MVATPLLCGAACGLRHSAAVTETGEVWSWGTVHGSSRVSGEHSWSLVPVCLGGVDLFGSRAIAVAAGASHTVAGARCLSAPCECDVLLQFPSHVYTMHGDTVTQHALLFCVLFPCHACAGYCGPILVSPSCAWQSWKTARRGCGETRPRDSSDLLTCFRLRNRSESIWTRGSLWFLAALDSRWWPPALARYLTGDMGATGNSAMETGKIGPLRHAWPAFVEFPLRWLPPASCTRLPSQRWVKHGRGGVGKMDGWGIKTSTTNLHLNG